MFWIFGYLWILWSRTFGMANDKMQEYLDINLILETSFALRNGILWKSLIQLIYINISKLIYQQLIFQQLIFQQLFCPTANLSTANFSTANLSTANLITANLSTANFATAFKQINRNDISQSLFELSGWCSDWIWKTTNCSKNMGFFRTMRPF